MSRYVVVSTNNNPDYYFYAPYLERAWNTLGWGLVVMITSDVNPEDLKLNNPETKVFTLPDIEGVRKESIAQAGRLYAANYFHWEALSDTFLMTSDIDLLPLSNYWNPILIDETVYGHDLTGYTYYPMGYIAMDGMSWCKYMRLNSQTKDNMIRDAEEYKHLVYAPDWESWWNWDWAMITDRMKPNAKNITFLDRGRRLTGTYAYGRIDRGDSMQIPPGETLIDCHAENINVRHPDKLNKFLSIFENRYGKL